MTNRFRIWQEVVPPVPTFLDRTGGLAQAPMQHRIESLYDAGVDGVLVLGSAGEGPAVEEGVRDRAVAVAVGAMQQRLVVVGCGAQTTESTVRQLSKAMDSGAGAGLVLPPFYYGLSQDQLMRFFVDVADRSPLPILLYHIPGSTGNPFAVETVERLAQHPNVAGIKDSQGDFVRFLELHRRVGSDEFAIFQGVAGLVGPSLMHGFGQAMCTVTALAPGIERRMRQALSAGDLATAGDLSRRIAAVAELFRSGPYPLPVNMKLVSEMLGIGTSYPHDPAVICDEGHRDRLRKGVAELGLTERDMN